MMSEEKKRKPPRWINEPPGFVVVGYQEPTEEDLKIVEEMKKEIAERRKKNE